MSDQDNGGDLSLHCREACAKLRRAGFSAVAERFELRGRDLDRTPAARAIQAGIDRVNLRRAAVLDPAGAVHWLAVERDQAELVRACLSHCRVGEVRA